MLQSRRTPRYVLVFQVLAMAWARTAKSTGANCNAANALTCGMYGAANTGKRALHAASGSLAASVSASASWSACRLQASSTHGPRKIACEPIFCTTPFKLARGPCTLTEFPWLSFTVCETTLYPCALSGSVRAKATFSSSMMRAQRMFAM